jgi:hypothetical protein
MLKRQICISNFFHHKNNEHSLQYINLVATKYFELENHTKNAAKLKHCIISWSKQFILQNRKTNFQISTKFYVIELCKISTKKLTIFKNIVFHKSLVSHWTEKFIKHWAIEESYLLKNRII